jgi:hypothetical protein
MEGIEGNPELLLRTIDSWRKRVVLSPILQKDMSLEEQDAAITKNG